jgi:DNA-binding response OmpR family regulator
MDPTPTAQSRILVVEDDADLRTILRLQLTSEGFTVDEASDGAEAFARLQAERPDCVVLDLMMPVMNGFALLKRIRSIATLSDIPVLILTASADERSRLRSYQYQADAYMNKPYDLAELTAEVARLCAVAAAER